ncbi:hypothetical protein [Paraburkholderia sp. C35]|uniref:hypothetical protein n=1 Tax=Paraburkholderia sp. C35 TaxID=2126993 RepID=UPI0013A578F4|nr:hypothetical protein [Paraburkholderia sp. C35]
MGAINQLLDETRLRRRTIDEAWVASWPKPLYANDKAWKATAVLSKCKHLFDTRDHDHFASVTRKVLTGLRDPDEKLDRIRRLSSEWCEVFKLQDAAAVATLEKIEREGIEQAVEFARRAIGVPGFDRESLQKSWH